MSDNPTYEELLAKIKELESSKVERDQALKSLRENEELLEEAQRLAQIGSWSWIVASDTVKWSKTLYEITGVDPKQPPPTFAEHPSFYTKESWKALSQAVEKAVTKCQDYNLDLSMIRSDGQIRITSTRGKAVKNKSGLVVRLYGTVQDITDRKRIEEKLKESEQQYRTLGETIPYGVWLADATGYCTYVSSSFLEMVGMTLEQVQKFGWLHLLPHEDVEPTKEHWLKCVQAGEDFEREHRFRTEKGSIRDVLAIGRPIKDDKGMITKWVGLNLDITNRKQAEAELQKAHQELEKRVEKRTTDLKKTNEKLLSVISERKRTELVVKESEKKFRAIFDNANDGILVADVTTKDFVMANNRIIDFLGYSKDEILSLSVNDIHPKEALPRVINAFERMTRGEILVSENHPVQRKNGSIFYADISTSPIEIDQRKYLVGIFRDISERRKAEEVMKIFQSAVAASTDAIGMSTPEGKHYYQNEAFDRMFGNIGEDPPAVTYNDQSVGREVFQAIMEGKQWLGEVVMNGTDGRKLNVLLRAYAIFDEEGQVIGLVGVHTDITQRKVAEQALRKAHDELEKRVKKRTAELEQKTRSLEETNIALKVLMEHREVDKENLEENILFNVKKLILPYLEKAQESSTSAAHRTYLAIMERNLNEIISPFAPKLGNNLSKLTPAEIKIADLIKQGKSNKEIAAVLSLAMSTITTHRQRMRKKLGLTNKKMNLMTILSSK